MPYTIWIKGRNQERICLNGKWCHLYSSVSRYWWIFLTLDQLTCLISGNPSSSSLDAVSLHISFANWLVDSLLLIYSCQSVLWNSWRRTLQVPMMVGHWVSLNPGMLGTSQVLLVQNFIKRCGSWRTFLWCVLVDLFVFLFRRSILSPFPYIMLIWGLLRGVGGSAGILTDLTHLSEDL